MIGIMGGTGLSQLDGFDIQEQKWCETPFGEPSSILSFGDFKGQKVVFLARHGVPHKVAPHLINYRANLSAFKQEGVTQVIAVNAVGGIHSEMGPTSIAVPDQIIDYTYGRAATIYDGCHVESVDHIDFSIPYTESVRELLIKASKLANVDLLESATYGATQGPRLETSAEIKRMQRDGCDIVGMTGMPEASLARELGLDYACLALSVNWAAGITDQVITMKEIKEAIHGGMNKVHRILNYTFNQ
ncbi:MAG: 5'-methylthioinosine phosphorylase [Oleiphilaceae bacterium]|jgi:5'-deoxy-5'-methylthioadenosine phosphorylase